MPPPRGLSPALGAALLLLLLLLLAPLAPLALAAPFTAGNILLTLVGDGTAAGSAAPSAYGLLDRNSLNHVDVSVREYAVSGAGLAEVAGGNVAVPPGSSGITLPGNLADVGNVNYTWQPYGGKLSLSNDGTIAVLAGYKAPAGTFIGSRATAARCSALSAAWTASRRTRACSSAASAPAAPQTCRARPATASRRPR